MLPLVAPPKRHFQRLNEAKYDRVSLKPKSPENISPLRSRLTPSKQNPILQNHRKVHSVDIHLKIAAQRASSFTKTFKYPLERRDNSLSSFNRHMNDTKRVLVRLKRQHSRRVSNLSKISQRCDLILDMNDKFGTHYTYDGSLNMTDTDLEKRAKAYHLRIQRSNAAWKIQCQWRIFLAKKLRRRKQRMNEASICIQQAWRSYKNRVIRTILEQRQQFVAALYIQRQWKGYWVRRSLKQRKRESEMESNFDYFSTLRNKLQIQSAKLIQRQWNRYKFRAQLRKAKMQYKLKFTRRESKSYTVMVNNDMPKLEPISLAAIPHPVLKSPRAEKNLDQTFRRQSTQIRPDQMILNRIAPRKMSSNDIKSPRGKVRRNAVMFGTDNNTLKPHAKSEKKDKSRKKKRGKSVDHHNQSSPLVSPQLASQYDNSITLSSRKLTPEMPSIQPQDLAPVHEDSQNSESSSDEI